MHASFRFRVYFIGVKVTRYCYDEAHDTSVMLDVMFFIDIFWEDF